MQCCICYPNVNTCRTKRPRRKGFFKYKLVQCACVQGLGLSVKDFVWKICTAWDSVVDLMSQTFSSSAMAICTEPAFIVCRASPRGCRVLSGSIMLPEDGVLLLDECGAQFHRTQFTGAPLCSSHGGMFFHVGEHLMPQNSTTGCVWGTA